MSYTAPLADMRFALREVAGLERVAALPGYEHATDDTVDAVLEEGDAQALSTIGGCDTELCDVRDVVRYTGA